ncbi:cupin domain-containing protein [Janibacter terrae]|uniref:cupin domain-containing protein n=1 Tax=Janibacter terrae TaxID=103817 RepID=UPI00082D30D2|nr:cupin domain-containing protein [Janibacter terrae]MBA4084487.1 cupin [Kytococcus sp.]HBO54335.1 cupin [Janibacter terrae]
MTPREEAGAPTGTGLRRVTDLGPEDFARAWGREPRHVPAAALGSDFVDLLDTPAVDDLLSRRGLRTPFLRVAREGQTLADAEFTRGGGVGAGVADQLDDTALLRLFAEGHTLVLQGLHRTHPPVLDFAQDLAADLGHPVQVNAYVTPPQSRGFAAHYDVHDVFVLQCGGEKTWRLHPPVLEHPLRTQPWQDRRAPVEQAAQEQPHLLVTLRPGDVLYVPRGWLHAAEALGGVSTHLTVGVHVWHRGHLAEAVLDAARRGVAALAEARTPLRPGVDVADPDDLVDDLAVVRAALLDAVAAVDEAAVAAQLARRQRAAQRPAPVAPVATTEALAGEPVVVPREHLRAALEPDGEGAVLVSRAGRLPLDASEADAVTTWLAAEEPARLDPALARRLVVAGVAVPLTAPPA